MESEKWKARNNSMAYTLFHNMYKTEECRWRPRHEVLNKYKVEMITNQHEKVVKHSKIA